MAVLLVVVLLSLLHHHVRHALWLVYSLVTVVVLVAVALARAAKAGVSHDYRHAS